MPQHYISTDPNFGTPVPAPPTPPSVPDTTAAPAGDQSLLLSLTKAVGDALGTAGPAIGNAAVGFGKEAANRAVQFGSAVNSIPYLGDLTGAVSSLFGPEMEGVDADAAFANPDRRGQLGLEPEGTAQKFGTGAERVGEFFVPAGATRAAVTSGLGRMLPILRSTATRGPGGRFAGLTPIRSAALKLPGTLGGETLSATGVAAGQQGQFPEDAGMLAATGMTGGLAASGLASAISKSPLRRILPVTGAAALSNLASPLGSSGGQLSMFSSLRSGLTELGESTGLKTIQAILRSLGIGAGRTAAAGETARRPQPQRPPLQ